MVNDKIEWEGEIPAKRFRVKDQGKIREYLNTIKKV